LLSLETTTTLFDLHNMYISDLTKVKQNGVPTFLIHVSNDALVHVYINNSVDFIHKGLGTLFNSYILVENLLAILFIIVYVFKVLTI